MSHGECVSAAGGDGGGGRVTTCETVCHVCCTSSEEYHTNPTPVECPTVSVYQPQGVGEGGMQVCTSGPVHMTKMAALPVYMVKTFFSRTQRLMILKHSM